MGGGDSLQLKNGKVGAVLTPFLSKTRLKSLFLENNHIKSATVTSTSIQSCLFNKKSIYLKIHIHPVFRDRKFHIPFFIKLAEVTLEM